MYKDVLRIKADENNNIALVIYREHPDNIRVFKEVIKELSNYIREHKENR